MEKFLAESSYEYEIHLEIQELKNCISYN